MGRFGLSAPHVRSAPSGIWRASISGSAKISEMRFWLPPMIVESKSISVTSVQARSAGHMRLGDCGQYASSVHGALRIQPGLAYVMGASENRKCALPGSSSRGPFTTAAGSSPDPPSVPEDGTVEVLSASTRISRLKPAGLVSPSPALPYGGYPGVRARCVPTQDCDEAGEDADVQVAWVRRPVTPPGGVDHFMVIRGLRADETVKLGQRVH